MNTASTAVSVGHGAPPSRAQLQILVAALSEALQSGDEAALLAGLDGLVRHREQVLFEQLRRLTGDLQSALERFSVDSRLVDLAEKEVPDAHHRLAHVLELTDRAAHRTMDLVERCGPLAERTATAATQLREPWQQFRQRQLDPAQFRVLIVNLDRFLRETGDDMEAVRANLGEVLLAQGYQDLSGQIIRSVMNLVTELEAALVNLVRLSRNEQQPAAAADAQRGCGPAVPGINTGPAVADQHDVDALLSGLGM